MVKLFSIKQPFADKIFRKEKKVEFRRQNVKIETNELCLVYTSAPIKKLSGYFIVKEKLRMPLQKLWEKTKNYAGISKKEFLHYFDGCKEGTAIVIQAIRNFSKGLSLNDLRKLIKNFNPPQSYRNLSALESTLLLSKSGYSPKI